MLAKDRQKKIEKLLESHGAVLVSELMERFNVRRLCRLARR